MRSASFKTLMLGFSACVNEGKIGLWVTEAPLKGWFNMIAVYFPFWGIWMWLAHGWFVILGSHMEASLLLVFCSATARDRPSVSWTESDFQPSSPCRANYIIPSHENENMKIPFSKTEKRCSWRCYNTKLLLSYAVS